MSYCCCFDDCTPHWSKCFCCKCPELNRRKNSSRHPNIQYSPVSSSEEQASLNDRRAYDGRNSPFVVPFRSIPRGNITYRYALTQDRQPLFLHPQISVHSEPSTEPITEQLSSEEQASLNDRRAYDGRNSPFVVPFRSIPRGNVTYRYALTQDRQPLFLHPQISVHSEPSTEPITEQPSSRSFFQKFDLVHPESQVTPEKTNGLLQTSDLPVYRERAIKAAKTGGDLESKTDSVVQFSLHYDIQQSKLRVCLQKASDLPTEYYHGVPLRCKPFVMLHLEPDRRETLKSQKIKETHNPVFEENFIFQALPHDFIKLQTLVLRLYNSAQGNKAIGKACLPLSDVDLFGVVVQMKLRDMDHEEMESNYQGDLHISLSYSPVSCKLEGIIHKATGLRKHDFFGKADPYIKVIVRYKDKKVFRWKSTVKHNTLAPVYDEGFTYQVTEEMRMAIDVADIVISFYLIDYDYLSRNDKMGIVNIGKSVPSNVGRRHWNELLKSPCQRISFWHSIELATPAQKCLVRSTCNSPVPH